MKILIVKTSSLGDIIQCFPALDYLRHCFPDSQIDWVVEDDCAELLNAHPQIDTVLTINSRQWRKAPFLKENRSHLTTFYKTLKSTEYDLLFDFQGNLKSSAIVLGARAKKKVGFGWKSVHEWPNALVTSAKINPPKGKNIREDYLDIVKCFFEDESPYTIRPLHLKLNALQEQQLARLFQDVTKKPTLVCPFSVWPNKCLADDDLIKILKDINQEPYWFVWGSLHEKERAFRFSNHFSASVVLEHLDLPLLQHVMARCKLVIAMDSLPLHLCGTTPTPTLSFFGPSRATKFAPIGLHHCAIQGNCPYGQHFEKTCPKLRSCKTGLCLKGGENRASISQKISSIKTSIVNF